MKGMKNKPTKKDQHRTNYLVRLRPEHYEALKRLAAANDRPLTREVARAISEYLAREEASDPAPGTTP